VRAIRWIIEVKLPVEWFLLDDRQDGDTPAVERFSVLAVHDGRRQSAMLALIVVHSQSQLRQGSVRPVGGVAHMLHGSENQRDSRQDSEQPGTDNEADALSQQLSPSRV
jgi:hypothetical protein